MPVCVLTRRFTYSIYQTSPCNQASSEEDPAKGHNNVNKVLCGELDIYWIQIAELE